MDDHPLVREHLTALIQAQADLLVCGEEAADAPTALSLIAQTQLLVGGKQPFCANVRVSVSPSP